MKKKVGIIKRAISLLLVFLFSINSFAAVVSDNDGSAFITKAEFDSLKNSFQSQIDQYNTSIDSKIDGAIAAYLAGIRIQQKGAVDVIIGDPYNTNVIMRSCVVGDTSNYCWHGKATWEGFVEIEEQSYGYLDGSQWYELEMSKRRWNLSPARANQVGGNGLPFGWFSGNQRRDWTRRQGAGNMYWTSKGDWRGGGFGATFINRLFAGTCSDSNSSGYNYGFPIIGKIKARTIEVDYTSGTSTWPSGTAFGLSAITDPEDAGSWKWSNTYNGDSNAAYTTYNNFTEGVPFTPSLPSGWSHDASGSTVTYVPNYFWLRPWRFRDYIKWEKCYIVFEAKYVSGRTYQYTTEGTFRASVQTDVPSAGSIRPDPSSPNYALIEKSSLTSDWFTLFDSRTNNTTQGLLGFAIARAQNATNFSSSYGAINLMEQILKLKSIDLRYTIYTLDSSGTEIQGSPVEFWHNGTYYPNGWT